MFSEPKDENLKFFTAEDMQISNTKYFMDSDS